MKDKDNIAVSGDFVEAEFSGAIGSWDTGVWSMLGFSMTWVADTTDQC